MILLLEPLVDEFEDSPRWALAARRGPVPGDCSANSSPRFAKSLFLNHRSTISDVVRQRCDDISMSRPADATIRKCRAYFSAYAAKPGALECEPLKAAGLGADAPQFLCRL